MVCTPARTKSSFAHGNLPTRSSRISRSMPTTLHLALRPLSFLKHTPGRPADDFVFLFADIFERLIDRDGDFVGRVAGNVFAQSRTEYLASRPFGATGET